MYHGFEFGITVDASGTVPGGPIPIALDATISANIRFAIGIPDTNYVANATGLTSLTPTALEADLAKVVTTLKTLTNEGQIRILVLKFLTDHKVRIAITVGGEAGGGFGINHDTVSWGFSKRPI